MNSGRGGAMRVAFFGGSFDPPHRGHVAVARAARRALALDAVLFAPVGSQPLKPEGSSASFQDRVEMTRLAIAGEAGFAVSLVDAPEGLGAPNYTADSLGRVQAELPADGMLFCLMGADSFLSLWKWHRAAEIPFLASLVVASRPGLPLEDIRAALPAGLTVEPSDSSVELRSYVVTSPARGTVRLYLLPGLHIEISASEIREAIRGSAKPTDLPVGAGAEVLCPAVLEYIRARGLYR